MSIGKEYMERGARQLTADLLKALDEVVAKGDEEALTFDAPGSRTRVVVCTVAKFRQVLKDVRAKTTGITEAEVTN